MTSETPLNDTVTHLRETILPKARRLALRALVVTVGLALAVLGFIGYVIS
jgi:hypothetical protein